MIAQDHKPYADPDIVSIVVVLVSSGLQTTYLPMWIVSNDSLPVTPIECHHSQVSLDGIARWHD